MGVEKEGGSRKKERRTFDTKWEDPSRHMELKRLLQYQGSSGYETFSYWLLVYEDFSYSKLKLKQKM